MTKAIFSIIIIALMYVLYADGFKPYFNALSETNTILAKNSIPLDKMSRKEYIDKSLDVLQQECSHGLKRISVRDFRCKSNSTIPFLK